MENEKNPKKNKAMYKTDFNIDSISSVISSESMDILSGLIQDMDLELVDVKAA
jgi:hypothetical protein